MPSLRAVTWEQGRGRVGCWGCRDPFVGRAGEGTRTVPPHPRPAPAEGQPSAPGSQHTPFPAAHTRTHTGAGCSKSPGTGRGRAGLSLPRGCTLKPRGTQIIPGARPCQLPALEIPVRFAAAAKGRGGISRLQPGAPHGFDSALGCWSSSGQCCSPVSSSKCISDP